MHDEPTDTESIPAPARDAEDRLRKERELYEALLRAHSDLGEGLLTIAGQRITFANDAFCRMSGYRREELLALPSFLTLVHPDERGFTVANYRRRISGGLFVTRYETALRRADGARRECEIALGTLSPADPARLLVLVTDITERKQAEAALAERKAQLRNQHALHQALLNAQSDAGVGLFIIDGGKVIFANEAICRLYGYTEAEITELPSFIELAHPDDRERVLDNHRRRVAGEHFENRYDIAILTKAGERRAVEITVGHMPTEHGLRILVVMVDITERKKAEAEAHRLAAELESRVQERTAELVAANRELESFAYSISHDLRAPLRAIDGFSKLLLDEYGEGLDRQGSNYLDRVRRAAQRMGTLIDDLLDLSRVTRQGMRRDGVDLSLLARDILEELARAMPQRRVESRVEPGCRVVGDPQLLRVLLQNLLDNAWKYTARTAEARIEFGRTPGASGASFFVRDNGAGFDMRYADRLFVPFQRLHRPEDFEGSGVGLASVARVAYRHGGKVWAESSPGCGATFHFTLGTPQEFRP